MRSHQFGANCVWAVERLVVREKKGRYIVRNWEPYSVTTSRSSARDVEKFLKDAYAATDIKFRVRRYVDSVGRWGRG